ncbi:hypothetical protein CK623_04460 [Vandammella animalimorsus]|uniref:DUF5666 domain-containing protein n=1 Tax=Vandammella animalimorsus TaxID=2029117 RepID=A0A2A2AHR5_9BURK|nr:DUF5666 domain-containing protein [Vandammella animalimorsus]PAT37149.1 hypothetical protein CK625_08350 [Vandammella animalimorsus]PAT40635.1 hypothetical protein CK623_04460 [Vandammella animalimorsus]RMX11926.1 hypothetical protein EBQ34_09470 [Vandammella animalimorsus]
MPSTMQKVRAATLAALTVTAGAAAAETMKGRVDAIDPGAQTIQLNGITFQTTQATQYQGVGGLGQLKPGDRITIEFSRDGAQYVVQAVSK